MQGVHKHYPSFDIQNKDHITLLLFLPSYIIVTRFFYKKYFTPHIRSEDYVDMLSTYRKNFLIMLKILISERVYSTKCKG